MRKTNKKGFTIVELVIVIAVIAILASILIPTFAGVIGDATEAGIKGEAKALYTEYTAAQAKIGNDATDFYFVYDKNLYYCNVNGVCDPADVIAENVANEDAIKDAIFADKGIAEADEIKYEISEADDNVWVIVEKD